MYFCPRVVFDQDGTLVGAAEASAWDVGPGATASFSGKGIGQAPTGPVTHEVTALGVKYWCDDSSQLLLSSA